MKFLQLITFASVAFAVPNPMARQDSVVGTVNSAVKTLESSTKSNIDSINSGIDSLKGSVDPKTAKDVQDTLTTAIKGITSELKKATDSITKITTGAAGGVTGAVKGFGQKDVDQLSDTIKTANKVLDDVKSALDKGSKDLSGEAKKAIEGEVKAAQNAIGPFVAPLTGFGEAAKKVVGVSDVDTSALDGALGQITKSLQGLTGLAGGKVPNIGLGM